MVYIWDYWQGNHQIYGHTRFQPTLFMRSRIGFVVLSRSDGFVEPGRLYRSTDAQVDGSLGRLDGSLGRLDGSLGRLDRLDGSMGRLDGSIGRLDGSVGRLGRLDGSVG